MLIPLRTGLWLVALMITGLFCQGAAPIEIFPWDKTHHISPNGRFAVYNAVIHSREGLYLDNSLLIEDLKTSKVSELTGYAAYAQLLWSPHCTGLIVNNHVGSNVEVMSAFQIRSDAKGIQLSEDPELKLDSMPDEKIMHEYLWGLRWLNDRQYIVEHRWDTESPPYRETTERYRVTVGRGARLISRKFKPN